MALRSASTAIKYRRCTSALPINTAVCIFIYFESVTDETMLVNTVL
jgi:hypothetical protein